MKSLICSLGLAITFLVPSALHGQDPEGRDKIATADMDKLFRDYYKTKQVQKSYKEYEEDLVAKSKVKIEEIKEMTAEVDSIRKQSEEPRIERARKEELLRKVTLQQRKIEQRKKQFNNWVSQKRAALSEQAKIDFADIKKEIMDLVKEVGNTEKYDYIFNRTGIAGGGTPIVAYSKDAMDLTGVLLERLNKDAPEETEEEEKPEETAGDEPSE